MGRASHYHPLQAVLSPGIDAHAAPSGCAATDAASQAWSTHPRQCAPVATFVAPFLVPRSVFAPPPVRRPNPNLNLNQSLQIAADTYDAVICIGTFTLGHVRPEALHEMLRITKSGGQICFTVRDEFWLKSNFGSLLNELEQVSQAELTELQTIDYILSEGSKCKLVLLTVL